MSIIASSSASLIGFSAKGSGLPSKTIFAFFVTAARIESIGTRTAPLQANAVYAEGVAQNA